MTCAHPLLVEETEPACECGHGESTHTGIGGPCLACGEEQLLK